MGTLTATQIGIAVAVVAVFGLIAYWPKIKTLLPTWLGGGGETTDPKAALKALFSDVKGDILQSPGVRGACNFALTRIDEVIETYPNDADKADARTHIRALASLLVVRPSEAAK